MHTDQQRFWRHSIRTGCFLLLVTSLLLALSWVFAPRGNDAGSGTRHAEQRAFSAERRNSIDLFFLGDSSAFAGFSPLELWQKSGIASWVAAEPDETMSGVETMLKQVLKTQHPKMIVLEPSLLFSSSETASRILISRMKDAFSVFEYHDRWKTIRLQEILQTQDAAYHNHRKGQHLYTDEIAYQGKEWMIPSGQPESIRLAVSAELRLFLDTCRQNHIRVVLMNVPNASAWNSARHDAVQKLADQYQIPYIDLNLNREARLGLDADTDFADRYGQHLNYRGAGKVTRFLARWLQANANLPDHRSDRRYRQWNDDNLRYRQELEALDTASGRN